MARKFFVGGNWKMNGDKASIDEICSWLVPGPLDPNTEVVVGVPGCYLQYVADKVAGSQVAVAAQNCYKAGKGAFTGQNLENKSNDHLILIFKVSWLLL